MRATSATSGSAAVARFLVARSTQARLPENKSIQRVACSVARPRPIVQALACAAQIALPLAIDEAQTLSQRE
eukprot:COSAG03_NODE_2462_length_2731_cov_13.223322_3_plen_71_part_01